MNGDGGRPLPDPDRLGRVEAVFHQMIERPASEREAALLAACPDDAEMRAEVLSLLEQPGSAAGFLSSPALEVAAEWVSTTGPSLTGRQIGVFDIRELIGVGGMGEVYRAHDSKLGRDVAIKILPRAFKDDPDRAARFRREAHLLASLNHPNIGAVYGLEDADDLQALVLELVEGEDLSERLTRGPIPVAEALPFARQIAEALEAAHERGIIHRDLKPGNIKLRPDGAVKVLDFGLAKATEAADLPAADPTNSPTLTARATQIGMILGTAAYMAPEQALGKSVDRRADIWSFGVVLYEMLTGTRAFRGDDVPSTLSAVLSETPSFAVLPPSVPVRIRRLLERCLDRDPRTRLRDIGEARIEIARAQSDAPDATEPSPASRSWTALAWPALIIAVAALPTIFLFRDRLRGAPAAESRLAMTLGPGLQFPGVAAFVAVAPDGRAVAFGATRGVGVGQQSVGGAELYLRRLDDAVATPFGQVGDSPFFSPDGAWLAFFHDEKLRKVPIKGGSAVDIAPVQQGDGDWGEDVIVFSNATDRPTDGIRRISASGGPISVVTALDKAAGHTHHLAPQILPGGRFVLFTIRSEGAKFQLAVVPISGGTPRVILEDAIFGRYVGNGVLMFQRGSALLVARFDESTATLSGGTVPVLDGVHHYWRSPAWAISGGTFVYRREEDDRRALLWVNRTGVATPVGAPAKGYGNPRLSPSGDQIAVVVEERGTTEVWTYALGSGRLQMELPDARAPAWTPDGSQILVHRRSAVPQILSLRLGGSGVAETVVTGEGVAGPSFISKDGRTLVFHESGSPTRWDIMALDLRTSVTRPLVRTPKLEAGARLHPSGRWMAYATDVNGRHDVFVTPFPEADARIPVTIDGGREPVWSRDGNELFYRNGSRMFSARVRPGPSLSFDPPRLLFDVAYYQRGGPGAAEYDVARDGRFLMMKGPERETAYLGVILNWADALNKAVARP